MSFLLFYFLEHVESFPRCNSLYPGTVCKFKYRNFLQNNYTDVNGISWYEEQHLKYFYNWNYTSKINSLGISYGSTIRRDTLYIFYLILILNDSLSLSAFILLSPFVNCVVSVVEA